MNLLRPLALLALLGAALYLGFGYFPSPSERLSPEEFVRAYRPGEVLLDVRTPEEYIAGHLQGAINLDVSSTTFARRAARLPKDVPIYTYCSSGIRSRRAAEALRAMGYPIVDDAGGMDDLVAAGAKLATPEAQR